MWHEWELEDCMVKSTKKVMPKGLDTGPGVVQTQCSRQRTCLEEFIIHIDKTE